MYQGRDDRILKSAYADMIAPRLDRRRFEIVVAVTQPALRQTQAALGDDGLTWLALSPRVDQAAEQLRAARLAERVSLLPRMDRQRYLGLVSLVDVALDPPHYTGANTSFDALGLAVPLITLPSPLLRGSFTSGLYRQMGVTGLIVRDPDHYVELALAIAGDPALCDHWHATLREHNGAIFHDDRAVTELQDAWEIMLGGD